MTTLGIDLGTGSVKAAVLDDAGVIVAQASQAYRVLAPEPGWAESDPAQWLSAARSVVGQAMGAAGSVPQAVGFSGQMHGVVVVDASFTPLRPAILWADGRSVDESARMAADLGTSQLSRLGSPAVTGFAASTIAWLLAHEPDVMSRAAHVLQPKDWLRVSLGGPLATDPSDASGTLMYDVVAGGWSSVMIDWLGVDGTLLPPVLASTDRSGSVRIGESGIEVPCAVGGADTACALAGLGLGPGSGFVAVGSGAQVVRVMAVPELDATLRTHTFATAGPVGEGWYRIGAVQSSGLTLTAALAWLGASIPEAAAALAEGIRPSDPVFVPYLSGERTPFMDPTMRGSWHRLSLATDRKALLRSVLEGVAQAVALGVEAVQGSGDALPDVVPLIGGGTHDPAFQQLLADATGLTLAITDAPDSAVVGAALLAAGARPRPIVSVREVSPEPDAADLLRLRRGMMVGFARPEGQT
ncbi:MAG: xylulose kinase [Actinobacteria bacterium]|nr:xylulose kinase [Actinomycetota bacterium]